MSFDRLDFFYINHRRTQIQKHIYSSIILEVFANLTHEYTMDRTYTTIPQKLAWHERDEAKNSQRRNTNGFCHLKKSPMTTSQRNSRRPIFISTATVCSHLLPAAAGESWNDMFCPLLLVSVPLSEIIWKLWQNTSSLLQTTNLYTVLDFHNTCCSLVLWKLVTHHN